jgi:hypothetical protein
VEAQRTKAEAKQTLRPRAFFTRLAVMLSALAAWYAAILASVAATSMRWQRLKTGARRGE